jgi:hypothetical protein
MLQGDDWISCGRGVGERGSIMWMHGVDNSHGEPLVG